jgi:uncharacterized membrane protein YkvA (DUF1232 family)
VTPFVEKVKESKAFRSAKKRAEEYATDLGRLRKLVEAAVQKADAAPAGSLKGLGDGLLTSFRMLKAYAKGEYTKIPVQSLLLVIASVVYFVVPFDFIPDLLPGAGFLDDTALLAWTFRVVKTEIDAFKAWESRSS